MATGSVLSDGPPEADTLLEEPELEENLPDNDEESSTDRPEDNSMRPDKEDMLSPDGVTYETLVDIEREDTSDDVDKSKDEAIPEEDETAGQSTRAETAVDIGDD